MSCTVSELPSGCRLRGMGSASQATSNVQLTGGNGGGGVGSGGGSGGNGSGSGITTVVAPGGIHVGGVLTTTSVLGTGNNNALQEAPLQRQQSQKPCCFCWCCCCSCSWAKCLAIKNAEDNGPTKRDPASSDLLLDGEQPTLEEIRGWGISFDKLMKSPGKLYMTARKYYVIKGNVFIFIDGLSAGGRKVFRDFLRCEYSEENILFWLACEELKKESSPEIVETKARLIYEDYISILSPKEVSLDSRVREIVNRNMVEPTTQTFDEAQIQIYTLMHRDSYPRFINSQLFKSLAQLPEGVSASGSMEESPM